MSRLLRPRFFLYGAIIAVLVTLFVMRATSRESFQVTVMRSQGLPFSIENGVIRNLYTLHLQNKTDTERVYRLGASPGTLAGHAGVEYIIPQDRIALPALADRQLTVFVSMPMTSYTESQEFAFTVTDSIGGITQDILVRFRGP